MTEIQLENTLIWTHSGPVPCVKMLHKFPPVETFPLVKSGVKHPLADTIRPSWLRPLHA